MDDLQNIQNLIYVIRGQRVMLDSDIAGFYGVETKRLNEKVKRNPKRFAGEDFMFQLTQEEYDDLRLRSQIATIKKGRGSHSKYLPHVFTLLGVSMLSSVLESDQGCGHHPLHKSVHKFSCLINIDIYDCKNTKITVKN